MKKITAKYIMAVVFFASIMSPYIFATGVKARSTRRDMFTFGRSFIYNALEGLDGKLAQSYVLNPLNNAEFTGAKEYVSISDKVTIDRIYDFISSKERGSITGKHQEEKGELEGKLVIIDPGHGGHDPGSNIDSLFEKDLTLDISLKLKDIMESSGAKVIMTREDDSFKSLLFRSALANKYILELERDNLKKNSGSSMGTKIVKDVSGFPDEEETMTNYYEVAILDINNKISLMDEFILNPEIGKRRGIFDYSNGESANEKLAEVFDLTRNKYENDMVFVSVHINVYDAGTKEQNVASGIQVYYRDNGPGNYGVNSKYYKNYNEMNRQAFAESLLEELNSVSPFKQKWDEAYKSDFSVLRENSITSALVEVGFINNPSDRRFLELEDTREKLAKGIGNGIMKYFKNKDNIDNETTHQ